MAEREELQQIVDEEQRRKAQGLDPDPVLARRRGALLGFMREYHKALAAFDEAEMLRVELGLPVDPAIEINRGCALRDLHRPGEAMAAFQRADQQYREANQPPHPALAVNLGGLMRNLGRPEEALVQYDKALQQSLDMAFEPHYTIFMNRGVALYTLGRTKEAMEAYEQAEQQRERLGMPPDPLLMLNKAAVLDLQGENEAAIRLHDEADRVSLARGIAANPHICLNRGHTLLKLGQREAAMAQFDECLQRYRDSGADVPLFVSQRIRDAREGLGGYADQPHGESADSRGQPALDDNAAEHVELPGVHGSNDAFLSHRRRDGAPYARLIKLNFEVRGRRAFLDVDERQPSRRFDERLLAAIDASRSFVLLLTPGALDRCVNEGDWLRREIVHALSNEKLIVPVMLPEFKWPRADDLPEDIRGLTLCEGISYSHDYFPAFMDMLVRWCSTGMAVA